MNRTLHTLARSSHEVAISSAGNLCQASHKPGKWAEAEYKDTHPLDTKVPTSHHRPTSPQKHCTLRRSSQLRMATSHSSLKPKKILSQRERIPTKKRVLPLVSSHLVMVSVLAVQALRTVETWEMIAWLCSWSPHRRGRIQRGWRLSWWRRRRRKELRTSFSCWRKKRRWEPSFGLSSWCLDSGESLGLKLKRSELQARYEEIETRNYTTAPQ